MTAEKLAALTFIRKKPNCSQIETVTFVLHYKYPGKGEFSMFNMKFFFEERKKMFGEKSENFRSNQYLYFGNKQIITFNYGKLSTAG